MTNKRRGLGRGLDALMGDNKIVEEIKDKDREIIDIKIEDIIPNKNQPRREFEAESLEELAKSIEVYGVIQPIIVRKSDDKYEIVAGERRYRASKIANLKVVPAIVIEVSEEDSSKLALIENIQREDLNIIEEALAYKGLIDAYGLTQEELGKALGKSRSYISNTMRLLNLGSGIIDYLSQDILTPGHGKVLLGVEDENLRKDLALKVIDENLSVRETEELVKKAKNIEDKPKEEKKDEKKKDDKDPYIMDLEDEFMRTLGTKVNLVKGRNINKLEIEYYTEEDLERIYNIIVK